MSEVHEAAHPGDVATLAERRSGWTVEKHELALVAVATLAVWTHTIDEIRIGEFVAVPFGIANAALIPAWRRLRRGWRAATSIVFGLFWAFAVIPFHVVPLLEGSLTGQNISGLSRVVGGTVMVTLGIEIWRRRDDGASRRPPL